MQSGKNAMESMKDSAANAAASAGSAVEKTKATMQEKNMYVLVEKMMGHSPEEKAMAEEKKEERKAQTEIDKHEAHSHNTAAREEAKDGVNHPTGYSTGGHTDNLPTRTVGTDR